MSELTCQMPAKKSYTVKAIWNLSYKNHYVYLLFETFASPQQIFGEGALNTVAGLISSTSSTENGRFFYIIFTSMQVEIKTFFF